MKALEHAEFGHRLEAFSSESLAPSAVAGLHRHYRLLVKWNAHTSLVGPGTLEQAPELHYGEAIAALALLPAATPGVLTDVGSGAGFPGLVLAAARPNLRVVLVEARQRKWAFLKAAVRETGIPAECLLGTIDRRTPPGLPERMDWITLRALKLAPAAWRTLVERLAPEGRVLLWAGREQPAIPGEILKVVRTVSIPGSRWKRILELGRA